MQTQPTSRKERLEYALKQVGVNEIKDLNLVHNSPEYAMVYRQLFGGRSSLTLELISFITSLYPQISTDYIINGSGPWERTKIVTPPQHRQDIHLDAGATAAISQNGEAKVEQPTPKEEPKPDELFTPSDLARMMREQDVAGLVSIILQQKDEIIRIQREHITSMRAEMQFVDKTMFPPVK